METWKRNTACGYIVLRKPKFNFDAEGRGAYESDPPYLGNIYYGGIQRMPWFELDEAFYENTLPEEYKGYRNSIEQYNRNLTGINVSPSLEETNKILSFSNAQNLINEIAVVYSKLLAEEIGEIEVNPININHLGYDVLQIGNWSLIREGIFRVPSAFDDWLIKLNANGLFSDRQAALNYIKEYEDKMTSDIVEELPGSSYDIDIFEIGVLKE